MNGILLRTLGQAVSSLLHQGTVVSTQSSNPYALEKENSGITRA